MTRVAIAEAARDAPQKEEAHGGEALECTLPDRRGEPLGRGEDRHRPQEDLRPVRLDAEELFGPVHAPLLHGPGDVEETLAPHLHLPLLRATSRQLEGRPLLQTGPGRRPPEDDLSPGIPEGDAPDFRVGQGRTREGDEVLLHPLRHEPLFAVLRQAHLDVAADILDILLARPVLVQEKEGGKSERGDSGQEEEPEEHAAEIGAGHGHSPHKGPPKGLSPPASTLSPSLVAAFLLTCTWHDLR